MLCFLLVKHAFLQFQHWSPGAADRTLCPLLVHIIEIQLHGHHQDQFELVYVLVVYVELVYVFLGGSMVRNLATSVGETGDTGSVPELGRPLEEGMVTHSSILAWRIPWTEQPGELQSMGLPRVRHDWPGMYHVLTWLFSIFLLCCVYLYDKVDAPFW